MKLVTGPEHSKSLRVVLNWCAPCCDAFFIDLLSAWSVHVDWKSQFKESESSNEDEQRQNHPSLQFHMRKPSGNRKLIESIDQIHCKSFHCWSGYWLAALHRVCKRLLVLFDTIMGAPIYGKVMCIESAVVFVKACLSCCCINKVKHGYFYCERLTVANVTSKAEENVTVLLLRMARDELTDRSSHQSCKARLYNHELVYQLHKVWAFESKEFSTEHRGVGFS